MRINIIGTTSSGKTTFSRHLAKELEIPCLEMDALFWGPNWTFPEDRELLTRLEKALPEDSWVLDGNYSRTIPVKWARVDAVIWLDFPLRLIFPRAVKRAVIRITSQQELWPGTGNRETWRNLFSSESIVWWTVTSFARNRLKFRRFMSSPDFSEIRFYRLPSPASAERFLQWVKEDSSRIGNSSFSWPEHNISP